MSGVTRNSVLSTAGPIIAINHGGVAFARATYTYTTPDVPSDSTNVVMIPLPGGTRLVDLYLAASGVQTTTVPTIAVTLMGANTYTLIAAQSTGAAFDIVARMTAARIRWSALITASSNLVIAYNPTLSASASVDFVLGATYITRDEPFGSA